MPNDHRATGQPVLRLEDTRFLTGSGTYVDDIRHPGQTYGAVLRSPHAHAVIRTLDASAARALPGVRGVLTGAEIADRLDGLTCRIRVVQADGSDITPVTAPVLARERARYVGHPVAFVVADSPAIARDACEQIEVDYDERPAVVRPSDALGPDAPQIHDSVPGNRAYLWEVGDREATGQAFAAAHHIVRVQHHNHRIVVAPIEPRAINATYDAQRERWTLHCQSQGVHAMRAELARCLRVGRDAVRLITPDVGGAFGMKLVPHPEYVLAAHAAREFDCPVAWTADRSESFLADAQGRDLEVDAEGAFDADGNILAFRFRGHSNLGAHHSLYGPAVHTEFSMRLLGGMYRTPTFFAAVVGVFTNTTPTDAYRGAGRPEVITATELVMTQAARELGLAPEEIRRRNLIRPEEFPYETLGGFRFDTGNPPRNLEEATGAADLAGFEDRSAAHRAAGRVAGLGVAYYMERTGGMPSEYARLELGTDGQLAVAVGTQSSGQGHETVWAQLLEDALGIEVADTRLAWGDTDRMPEGHGTGGSRSAKSVGPALQAAAGALIEAARPRAADQLEVAIADLVFLPQHGGQFSIAGTDRRVSLAELAARAPLQAAGSISGTVPTFPNGCHVCEVVLDPDTGAIDISRYTVVDDFGVVLNPLIVAGQVHGGIAQAIGQVICEEAGYDPDTGQPTAPGFMDYAFPRADLLPAFDFRTNEYPALGNILGVKGCGESGSVGSLPCVTLAVLDALARAGVEPVPAPFTPEKVWRALRGIGKRADAPI